MDVRHRTTLDLATFKSTLTAVSTIQANTQETPAPDGKSGILHTRLTFSMSVPPIEHSVSDEGSSERGKTFEEDPFAPRFL